MDKFTINERPVLTVDSPYSISGADCQVLTVALKPQQEIASQSGNLEL